jgi:hypothetical protein
MGQEENQPSPNPKLRINRSVRRLRRSNQKSSKRLLYTNSTGDQTSLLPAIKKKILSNTIRIACSKTQAFSI